VCVVATVLVVPVTLAFPALASAGSTDTEGVAVKPITTTSWEALLYWTRSRLENAEPLSVLTLPGSPPEESGATPTAAPAASPAEAPAASSGEAPAVASTAALSTRAAARASAVEGVEVTASESTVFPNGANGKVFGAYNVNGKSQPYECSGSVVDSRHGDVVLTAGHCGINRETGEVAEYLIFIPGYRERTAPYGIWTASLLVTTETWEKTAKKGSSANEGGDVALLTMRNNSAHESLEEVVGGSLGIAFDQPCNQVYTQLGYPAEAPYTGEILYSHTAAYAGADTNLFFTPEPMKIASDFTPGSSGGPWTVGPSNAPTVLSLTAYGYENQPGYLYGPYFGEVARKAYVFSSGENVPAGIEEACKPLPPPPQPEPPVTPPTTTPPEGTTPTTPVRLKVKKVRRRADGSAVVITNVGSAGTLKLTGSAVRADSLDTPGAGNYKLIVAAKGAKNRLLKQRGRAKVGVKIAFSTSGKVSHVSRSIQLSRRSTVQAAAQRAARSG
jgi:V8-like Glu-specific endopeptidase